MNRSPGGSDHDSGLEQLRAALAAGNPELYRHIALYLQVLRTVLPERVAQACFHLATQVHPQRYLGMEASRRLELQQVLHERVQRCSSLLTVEQLVALALRLDREQRDQQRRRQQQLMQQLLQPAAGLTSALESSASGPETDDEASAKRSGLLPPGSVQLDLASPLDLAALNWDLDVAADAPAEPGDDEGSAETTEDEGDGDDAEAAALMAALLQGLLDSGSLQAGETHRPEAAETATDSSQSFQPAERSQGRLGLGRQLTEGNIAARHHVGEGPEEEPWPHAHDPAAPDDEEDATSPWTHPGLPQDPVLLVRWIDGLEAALVRRLRNLSHAINVDLMRLGLSRGLLPLSLLEAVLAGQVETLSAPANVLRLQLPFGLRPGAPPLQAFAILLRPVDLEMEEPRLRTCRRAIQQHRQQVRRMAHTYRRLQRRLQAHEAEHLWLQDIRASRRPGS